MAQIPLNIQFIGLASTVDTTERRSAIINAESAAYTMQDIVDTARPYKVFTALLTQSGGDNLLELVDGDSVTKGVTYLIDAAGQDTDFSNVGGPKYEGIPLNGTYFIATTDEIPNNYGGAVLIYNTGAPVVTVLENTIGNIWFSYVDEGRYDINSSLLFTRNKTTVLNGGGQDNGDISNPGVVYSLYSDENSIYIWTFQNGSPILQRNNVLINTMLEIRVYP